MSWNECGGRRRSPAEQVEFLLAVDLLPADIREALLALQQQSVALPAFDRSLHCDDVTLED